MTKIDFFDLTLLQREALLALGWVACNGTSQKKGIKLETQLTTTGIVAKLLIPEQLIVELNDIIRLERNAQN